MDREAIEFIKEKESQIGAKIGWRTFSTWFGSNNGILREYGVFLCAFDDSLYFEDFERLPTFLGYPIQRKKKVEYVRYDRTIKASDIKAITLVRKRDAEKAIREKALNPLPKANKLISLFTKTVTQVELSSGELLYFELISIKEFEKIVKELKNGSI